jgi:MFS family permease
MRRLARSRTFTSLRTHRNYRLYFAGQIASVCGSWMQDVALYWLVLSLTHSPVAVGLLSLARFGPYAILGLASGVVADRFDNRRTVIITQSVQMALSALLAALTLLGHAHPWELYLIGALLGTAVVFDLTARQSLTVQLVGRAELPNAIALNSSLFNTARIFGPALAGVLIAAFGTGWCFAVNSVSFLSVLAALVAMRTTELYPLLDRRRPSFLRGTREGLVYAVRTPSVRVLVAVALVVMSFSFNLTVLLPILTKATLHAGPQTLGAISACFGVGALIGSFIAAAIARPSMRLILSAIAVIGISELALAPIRQVVIIGSLLFACGMCFTLYTASSNAAIQLGTPDYIRGRVIGIYFYAWNAPSALASPLLGWLCAVGGTELGFAFSGICAIAASGLAAVALRHSPKQSSADKPLQEQTVSLVA